VQKSAVESGVRIGLRLWLFFLIFFALIGYSTVLSIFFGAIGGLAGGMLTTWKATKSDLIAVKPPEEEIPEPEPEKEKKRMRRQANRPTLNAKYRTNKRREAKLGRWLFSKRS
jgi:hypothetical protein